MTKKVSNIFLLIVVTQATHSIEEYIGKLWENFPPATFLCSLLSEDLETGFLIINIGLFIAGLSVWYFLVRRAKPFATFFIWFWIGIEIMNGIGHPVWSFMQQSYTPGVITAPFLLMIALYLMKRVIEATPSAN